MLSAVSMTAQRMVETVYLKNGGLVKGEIIEQIPGESLKVKTKDGSIFVYQMDEVEKIAKEAKSDTPVTEHQGLDFNVDLGYNISTKKDGGGNLVAGVELGKRISENFYLGVGSSAYIPSGNGDIAIPITTAAKVYTPLNNSKVTPFVGLRTGYVINTADDVTMGTGKNAITIEQPDFIMIEIMPGVQIPLSKSIDFNFAAGYTHFIPTKGSGGTGAIAIRAGFGFYKSDAPKTPKIPKVIPTRNSGFQLTFEADGTNLWSIGSDSHFYTGGGNVVLGYKLNENISFGVGYGCAYMSAYSSITEKIYSGSYEYRTDDNGKNVVITNEGTDIVSENYGTSGDVALMHKYFLRGQYRLNNERFSPIANIDIGFRKYVFDTPNNGYYYDYGDASNNWFYDEEDLINTSPFFISPSVGFSLRTTNNSYFEMRLGYTMAPKIDGMTDYSEYGNRPSNKTLYVYELKPRSMSGVFLTIGWTHTFGSRK